MGTTGLLIHRRYLLAAAFLGLAATHPLAADTLHVGRNEHNGAFEGYDGRNFLFREKGGKYIKKSRFSVSKLTLDKPMQARIRQNRKKKPEAITLLGYEKSKFKIKQNGKERTVLGMLVKKLSVPMATVSARASGGGGDAPSPIQPLNLTNLELRKDLTAAEKAVIDDYKRARKTYDNFLAASTTLVRRMQNTAGAQREELMNQLRRRKQNEQPILRTLEAAIDKVMETFPDPGAPIDGTAETYTPPKGEDLPDASPDQIIMIDVSGLKSATLTKEQTKAVDDYEVSLKAYQELAKKKPEALDQKTVDTATQKLLAAQKALLKAFPQIKFVSE